MSERIMLPERLDTRAAQALATELLGQPKDAKITLDGSAVSHFGAQAAQVILSAAKTSNQAGGSIVCEAFSDRATGQLASIGLNVDLLMEGAQ